MSHLGPRETELKLAFDSAADAEHFQALLHGHVLEHRHQENHFFDTASHALNRDKLSCRLRLESTAAWLTLKGPSVKSGKGLVTSRPELERAIDAATAQAILQGVQSPLTPWLADLRVAHEPLVIAVRAAVADQPLGSLGSFVNERTCVRAPIETVLGTREYLVELDCTRFPNGRIDYEAEIETADEAEAQALSEALTALCRQHAVATHASKSKLHRFMACLASQAGC